jgi:hypothetical protein
MAFTVEPLSCLRSFMRAMFAKTAGRRGKAASLLLDHEEKERRDPNHTHYGVRPGEN